MATEELKAALAILRIKQVKAMVGLSRSQIYFLMSQSRFPKQLSLSQRAVGWTLQSVQDWLADRVAESRQGV